MNIEIRTAQLGDLTALAELGKQTFREHFSQYWHDTDVFLNKDFSLPVLQHVLAEPNKHRYLLAFIEDILVGFAKVNFLSLEPCRECVGLELQKIYLTKESVGHHIGSALFEQIISLAHESNSSCIWLNVLEVNEKARAFYTKFGFEQTAEFPFQTDKCLLNMLVMQRNLI